MRFLFFCNKDVITGGVRMEEEGIKCRLIEEIGTRVFLRVYWDGCKAISRFGTVWGYHNAMKSIFDTDKKIGDFDSPGRIEDYDVNEFPTTCEHCGEVALSDANKQVFRQRLYNSESGSPEPGDMYYADWYHQKDRDFYCRNWDNCNDSRGHLIVVLPNRQTWDLNSRARNCTLQEDRVHRCWVLHGEAPELHVDKNGLTCAAGAGSIDSGDGVNNYHGYLHSGRLKRC